MISLQQGDMLPVLDIYLVSEKTRQPIDITGIPVEDILFTFYNKGTEARVSRRAVTGVVESTDGHLQVYFTAAELATAGVFQFQIEVTFPDGRELTLPSRGYETVEIGRSL